MKKFLTKIFISQRHKQRLRSPKSNRKSLSYGFTLIELLVAALIASILVTVLLSFLVGVLDSDRKETLKTNAQEELQSAANFIADELQEAIYIYGADGLASINSQLPHKQTNTQCNDTNCSPVLVFWKRFAYDPNSNLNYGSLAQTVKVGCMPYKDFTTCENAPYPYGGAKYAYSLVAYYLKNDDPTISGNNSEGFSTTARILRWEIKDGIDWFCANVPSAKPSDNNTNCPASTTAVQRGETPIDPDPTKNKYLGKQYFVPPSKGFSTPKDPSNKSDIIAWTKYANFNFSENPFITLVDFMDDSDSYPPTGVSNPIISSINTTVSGVSSKINTVCDDPSVGVGNTNPASATNPNGTVTQRVPNQFNNSDGSNPSKLSSFYACVAPDNTSVRFYLRGSAISRLATPSVSKSQRKPNANNLTFFPTADVRSFGRGSVGITNAK